MHRFKTHLSMLIVVVSILVLTTGLLGFVYLLD